MVCVVCHSSVGSDEHSAASAEMFFTTTNAAVQECLQPGRRPIMYHFVSQAGGVLQGGSSVARVSSPDRRKTSVPAWNPNMWLLHNQPPQGAQNWAWYLKLDGHL